MGTTARLRLVSSSPKKQLRADGPRGQRNDAASTKRRNQMRDVAKQLRRFVTNGASVTRIGHQRGDGWENSLTMLGNASRDKRLSAGFRTQPVVDLQAEDVWRGDPFFARIVNTVPEELGRAGWEIQVQPPPPKKKADATGDVFPETAELDDGKEIAEGMEEEFKKLGLSTVMETALKNEIAKGGAAIWPIIDDGVRDLTTPLNLDRVRKVKSLETLEPLELIPYQWYSDPLEPKFGEPELYWMQRIPTGNIGGMVRVPIHESRLILFPGIVVSRRQLREHWGWGDSILVRVNDALRDFQQSWGGAFVTLQDFSQAVYAMAGLAAAIADGEDDLVMKRVTAMDAARSIIRGIIIDKDGESFARQTTSVAGLADLLDRCCNYLAAVAQIPVTILMGQAPAGLNATGAADIRAFFDRIAAQRPKTVEPKLNRIAQLVFRSKEGPTRGREPKRWSFKFGNLWQQTEGEVADTRKKVADADSVYIDKGVLLPEEVAKSRFGGDTWNMETVLDQSLREKHDEEVEAEAEAEAEMLRKQVEATLAAAPKPGEPAAAEPAPKEGGETAEKPKPKSE